MTIISEEILLLQIDALGGGETSSNDSSVDRQVDDLEKLLLYT